MVVEMVSATAVGLLDGRPTSASWRSGALEGDPALFLRLWSGEFQAGPRAVQTDVASLSDVLPAFDRVTRLEMVLVRTDG
jgi:hypothetical protein